MEGWKSGGSGICGLGLFLLISLGVECLRPSLDAVSNGLEGVLGARSTGEDLTAVAGVRAGGGGGAPSKEGLGFIISAEALSLSCTALDFLGSASEVYSSLSFVSML